MRRLIIMICFFLAASVLISCSEKTNEDNIERPVVTTTATVVENNDPVVTTTVSSGSGTTEPVTDNSPELDDAGFYLIRSAEDMVWLSDRVNGSTTEANDTIKAKLENDIDMSSVGNWIPIGSKNSNMFKGEFNGNGKTVSGLNVNSDGDYIALFGVIYDAVIKDLVLADSFVSGEKFVAGICASNSGTLVRCVNHASVNGNGTVGGICAVNYGRIENCRNTGNVNAGNTFAGGVSGYSMSGAIIGCSNVGTVMCEQVSGGISGYDENGIIVCCENSGNVVSKMFAGGICGRSLSDCECTISEEHISGIDSSSARIYDCKNSGNVSVGEQYAGGICAHSSYVIEHCENTGIIGSADSSLCAGICAFAEKGAIYASVNRGPIGGENKLAGIAAHSDVPIIMCSNSGDVGFAGDTECVAAGVCVYSTAPIISCLCTSRIGGSRISGICIESAAEIIYCVSACELYVSEGGNYAMILHELSQEPVMRDCYSGYYNVLGAVDYGSFEIMEIDAAVSGEAAYILQNSYSSDEYSWGQYIGTDVGPSLSNNDFVRVYRNNVYYSCDIGVGGYFVYSNESGDVIPEHSFEDGVCTVCGAHENE